MRRLASILLPILLWAAPAVADVTLHYAPDGQGSTGLLIQADGRGHVRASVEVDPGSGARPGIELLLDGDQAYMIDRTASAPALARIEDVMALATEARMRLAARPARPLPAPVHLRISAHGPARVGQWDGILHWVEPDPPRPGVGRGELIVSNDPALAIYAPGVQRVLECQGRLLSAVLGMPDSPDAERMLRELLAANLLLRDADTYHLDRISTDPVPAERFAIAGPVLTRDQLRALHAGQ